MDPFLQDKLADLIVTIVGVLIGGGLIVAFVEWQRHMREKQQWDRQQARLEIDTPRAEILFHRWAVHDKQDDKTKLAIYQNELVGKVSSYQILVDFVVRNTTSGEIIITTYGVDDPAPPGGAKSYHLHDMVSFESINPDRLSATKLIPLGSIARTVFIDRNLGYRQKLDDPPSHVTVFAETSEGIRLQKDIPLTKTGFLPLLYNKNGYPYLESFIRSLPEQAQTDLGFTPISGSDTVEEEIPF